MSNNFDIPYQPLTEPLSAKAGTHPVTDDWLVTLPINHLDPIKLEWVDNAHLIFVLPTDSVSKIEKINTNTGMRILLSEGDTPKPSPDGQWISFTKDVEMKKQLWLMRSDGTEIKQLTQIPEGISLGFYKYNFNLAWSHNSKLIALMHPIGTLQSAIDVIDINTGKIKRILSTDEFQLRSILWSSDDKKLFIWKEMTEGESESRQDKEYIQLIDLSNEQICTLAQFDGLQQMLDPVLSPNGEILAIMYDPDHPYFDTTQNIGLLSAKLDNRGVTLPIKQLTHELKLLSLQWSPDGQSLYALRVHGAYKQIYRIDANTGQAKQITGAPFSIDWNGYALSPDGSKLALTAVNAHATRIIRVITSDGQFIRDFITIQNAPNDMALSEVREIEWETTNYPDHMRGLLVLPLNYQSGTSYPLIIDIHGGGSGAGLNLAGAILVSTPLEWQMWAAKGYIVFIPEFRSSGAFGTLADTRDHYQQHDLINQDIIDIETGIDRLVEDGLVNHNSMAVIGHSAGARRVNWLIATRHQFSAAVSKEGWADELSAVSDPIPAYPIQRVYRHFGGSPQETPENYLKNSALFHANDVTIPTLFLMGNPKFGGIDFKETIKKFYSIIKAKEVETNLIYYSDEGHIFEKRTNRLDTLRRSEKWIDEHVSNNYFPLPSNENIPIRRTARAIILNKNNQVLLIKIKGKPLHSQKYQDANFFWITVGGEVEKNETADLALQRELREEVGITNPHKVELIAFGEQILPWKGLPTKFVEKFYIVYIDDIDLSNRSLTHEETIVIDDYCWWSLNDLQQTQEIIFPTILPKLVNDYITHPNDWVVKEVLLD